MSELPPDGIGEGALLGHRYLVTRRLGSGGMAAVYQVVDQARQQTLALKRLHPERACRSPDSVRLFELEYHVLAQLAHPHLVQVYDYQKHDDGAYYTMELLAGDDLRSTAPMPWRELCRVLSDVCSALCLLHSRRFVHRDITPRNIRRTEEGHGKLIDFGALAPFGTHKHVVGTPPFIAPEALVGQPLDGRTDLFSLGVTAYFALTGKPPFRARSFSALRNAWRSAPALPSRYVPEIPPEIDQLVMWLISLAPASRPRSAVEVLERLATISGQQLDAPPEQQLAFLSTPTLVGRDAPLLRIRQQMVRASRGRGSAVLLSGPAGVGRSRLVDACALEAKLAGATVLRADAQDAGRGDWGGVRSMLDQLALQLAAEASEVLQPYASTLAHIWPEAETLTGFEPRVMDNAASTRSAVQRTLLELLLGLTDSRFVAVCVDDLHLLDEPTAALVALLSQRTRHRRMAVMVSVDRDAATSASLPALTLLDLADQRIELQPLSVSESERLFSSVFGDVPNVRLLADRLHAVAEGMPRGMMELAQELLERGVVRHQRSGWMLPTEIDQEVLPATLSAAMRSRLQKLDAGALSLACAIALGRRFAWSLDDCARLCEDGHQSGLLDRLDALLQAQVVRREGEVIALAQPAWSALLLETMDSTQAGALHERLSRLFEREGATLRAAEHRLAGGQESAAVDLTLQYAKDLQRGAADPALLQSYVQKLPSNWAETLDALLAVARRSARPRVEILQIRCSMLTLHAMSGGARPELARSVIDELARDSGLVDYHELPTSLPPQERLQQALQRAQERYDATPVERRGLTLVAAITQLARATTQAVAMMAASGDYDFLNALPALEPFAPLSPALKIIDSNRRGSCNVIAGRTEQTWQAALERLRLMSEPGGIGLEPAIHRYMELSIRFTVGLSEALGGLPSACEHADAIAHDALFVVNAWRLRKIQALRRGDVEDADRCAKRIELLRIQNNPPQLYEGADSFYELLAYVEIGDVVRIEQTLPSIEARGEAFPCLRARTHFARGHCHRLRGETQAAIAEFEAALAGARPGRFVFWTALARGYLLALCEAGRIDEARRHGQAMLLDAQQEELTVQITDLYVAMAQVELAAGDHSAARCHLDALFGVLERWPWGNLYLGCAHELAARLAIATGDEAAFRAAADSCRRYFLASTNPVLIGRAERLLQDAARAGLDAPASSPTVASEVADEEGEDALTETGRAFPLFLGCNDPAQRTRVLVEHLRRHGAGDTVLLFLLRKGCPTLVGRCGERAVPHGLKELVETFVSDEMTEEQAETISTTDFVTATVALTDWVGPQGDHFAPALLAHESDTSLSITGVVVFSCETNSQLPVAVLERSSVALTEAGDVVPIRV